MTHSLGELSIKRNGEPDYQEIAFGNDSVTELKVEYKETFDIRYTGSPNSVHAWVAGNAVEYSGDELKIVEPNTNIRVAAILKLVVNDTPTYLVEGVVIKGEGRSVEGGIEYRFGNTSLEDYEFGSFDGITVKIENGQIKMICNPSATGTIMLPRLIPQDGSFTFSVALHIIDRVIDAEAG